MDARWWSQWQIGPDHSHDAAILTAQLAVPHWNQLQATQQTHTASVVSDTNTDSFFVSIPTDTVHLPLLEELRNTPAPCAAHPQHPPLETLEGLDHAPADACKVPLSAD